MTAEGETTGKPHKAVPWERICREERHRAGLEAFHT